MKDQDSIRRFIFEELGVRGEWVKLQSSWQAISNNHEYPPMIEQQLGQALAATVLLSATIKFEGSLILQIQGTGALKTLVAQCTHDRFIRGIARYSGDIKSDDYQEIFGAGRLVLTIEPDNADPYQGIVQLSGQNVAESLQSYFTQSEQLKTRLWLFANNNHVAGLFLQELPSQNSYQSDWDRIEALANTVTARELLDLPCEEMLFRLFNEEKVRLFKPEPVIYRCSCSTKKIENTLSTLGRKALEEILLERDAIIINCEFCNQHYTFDRVDIERILSENVSVQINKTKH